MMRLFLALLSCFCWCNTQGLIAQITMTLQDRPSANTTVVYGIDTLVENYSITAPGPNQDLDYDTITGNSFFPLFFVDPADVPGAAAYPTADVALTLGDFAQLLDYTDDCTTIIGQAMDLSGTGESFSIITFSPPQKTAAFPFTLGDSYTDFSSYTITVDGSDIGLDSIRGISSTYTMAEADASGQVSLPDIGYFDALRVHETRIVIDSIFVLVMDTYQLAQINTDTIERFTWLSKETKGTLLQGIPREDGGFQVLYFIDLIAAPIAAFTYEDQGGGHIDFTSESSNFPSGWAWDFGDGTNSNLENPTHTYAMPGDYTVCLNVNNPYGVDSSCQVVSILISDVSAAPTPAPLRVFPNPTSGIVHFQWQEQSAETQVLVLYNALGRKVQQHQMPGNLQISLAALPDGYYFYEVRTEESLVRARGRISKQ